MLPLLLLILLLSSCGLNTYIYIYPPIASGGNLSFSHDSRNNKDPNFITLGYDIYYRIYDNSSTSDFSGKTDSEITSIIQTHANDFFTSVNLNNLLFRNFPDNNLYRPIVPERNDKSSTYNLPPILPIDNSVISNTSFYVNMYLNNTTVADPYIETEAPYGSTTLPETIWFRRYLDATTYKDFSSFLSEDNDISFNITENNFLVAFFVLSYGFTVDFYTITSDKPLFIGTAHIN